MSDPISVAGTAIGVVSLGLSLCQNLVDYVEALQDRKNSIQSTLSRVECLRTTLDMVKDAVSHVSPNNQNVVDAVEKCLREGEAEMRRLDAFLKNLKCDYIVTDSKSKRVKSTVRKLLYPFKKGNIQKLENDVQTINVILATALQALEIDIDSTQSKQLSSLISASTTTSATVDSVLDGVVALRTDVSNLSSDLLGSGSLIEQDIKEVCQNVSIIVPEIRSALPAIEHSTAETTRSTTIIQSNVQAIGQGIGEIRQELFASSGGLKRTSDLVQSLFSDLTQFRSDHASRMESLNYALFNIACCVNPMPYVLFAKTLKSLKRHPSDGAIVLVHSSWVYLGRFRAYYAIAFQNTGRHQYHSDWFSLSLEKEFTLAHLPNCPFYSPPEQRRSVKARVVCLWAILATTVSIGLSFTAGAGGYSIAPYLSWSRVVPWDSPAFELLLNEVEFYVDANIGHTKAPRDFHVAADATTDLNEAGQSLCHVVMDLMKPAGLKDDRVLEAFNRLLRMLSEVGVPLNQIDTKGYSPMDRCMVVVSTRYPFPALAHIFTSMSLELIKGGLDAGPRLESIEAGLGIGSGHDPWYEGPFYQKCLSMCQELAEGKIPNNQWESANKISLQM
ncbi:uncharacterized protein BDZ99DRAFT_520652 [Mytilinidion resinicola]|uniref:Fungal N-terminal domain-containing protein n=1 Tax=Mytilinidion resinicola TaxID=574789 RepID=A0A6A6YN39_9PEZI|nr:uncharacterized protein BDZ99DRAFT_520652 [Mytilinidion resinicola]KAF2809287.1 hypothetical protein BDZ99DRAFT_520652 [Mytilinidion resinicola]